MPNQGVRRNRLPATQTCIERGWGAGTKIESDEWTLRRMIRSVGPKFVAIRFIETGHGTFERVRSFPTDVREIPA
jgi:hypothetical protein